MASPPQTATNGQTAVSHKRKRSISPSTALPTPPPAKALRISNSSPLHINYLARQYDEILPLITSEDTLPALLALISDYDGVLQRHESMAGNLGARPLGPMIIKRFERLFDSPPRVLKTHGKEGTQITWLDVVEFARNKPEQFNLEKMRDGVRVCQFYTKQCRVEISEEDFELLKSGVPQKMIPPQPIGEDEEKELGTLEILEKNLGGVVQLADQVSARARQLNHRLKNRKSAIVSRRSAEREAQDLESPTGRENPVNGFPRPSTSPTGGFTAVNARSSFSNGTGNRGDENARPAVTTNGNHHGASAATRDELLSKFRTSGDRDIPIDSRLASQSYFNQRPSLPAKSKSKANQSPNELDYPNNLIAAASQSQSAVAIPHTPTSLLAHNNNNHTNSNSSKPTPVDSREDNGPYKADMMLRMEQLNRADRVQPPCDRCRRLHMDCLKNLTACIGCTKKHAKCSWKDVTERELQEFPFVPRVVLDTDKDKDRGGKEGSGSEGGNDSAAAAGRRRDWSAEAKANREVRDEELLGEEEEEEEEDEDSDEEMGDNVNETNPSTATAASAAAAIASAGAAGATGAGAKDEKRKSISGGSGSGSAKQSSLPRSSCSSSRPQIAPMFPNLRENGYAVVAKEEAVEGAAMGPEAATAGHGFVDGKEGGAVVAGAVADMGSGSGGGVSDRNGEVENGIDSIITGVTSTTKEEINPTTTTTTTAETKLNVQDPQHVKEAVVMNGAAGSPYPSTALSGNGNGNIIGSASASTGGSDTTQKPNPEPHARHSNSNSNSDSDPVPEARMMAGVVAGAVVDHPYPQAQAQAKAQAQAGREVLDEEEMGEMGEMNEEGEGNERRGSAAERVSRTRTGTPMMRWDEESGRMRLDR